MTDPHHHVQCDNRQCKHYDFGCEKVIVKVDEEGVCKTKDEVDVNPSFDVEGIQVNPRDEVDLESLVREARELARVHGCEVKFTYNGIDLSVTSRSSIDDLVEYMEDK